MGCGGPPVLGQGEESKEASTSSLLSSAEKPNYSQCNSHTLLRVIKKKKRSLRQASGDTQQNNLLKTLLSFTFGSPGSTPKRTKKGTETKMYTQRWWPQGPSEEQKQRGSPQAQQRGTD